MKQKTVVGICVTEELACHVDPERIVGACSGDRHVWLKWNDGILYLFHTFKNCKTQKEAADLVSDLSAQIGCIENDALLKCCQLAGLSSPLELPLPLENGQQTELDVVASKSQPSPQTPKQLAPKLVNRNVRKRQRPSVSQSLRKKYLTPKRAKRLQSPKPDRESGVNGNILHQILDLERQNSKRLSELSAQLSSVQNQLRILDERTHPWIETMGNIRERARLCQQLR